MRAAQDQQGLSTDRSSAVLPNERPDASRAAPWPRRRTKNLRETLSRIPSRCPSSRRPLRSLSSAKVRIAAKVGRDLLRDDARTSPKARPRSARPRTTQQERRCRAFWSSFASSTGLYRAAALSKCEQAISFHGPNDGLADVFNSSDARQQARATGECTD